MSKLSIDTKKKWLGEMKGTLQEAIMVSMKLKFGQPDAQSSLVGLVLSKLESFSNLYLETQDELDRYREKIKVERKSRSKQQIPMPRLPSLSQDEDEKENLSLIDEQTVLETLESEAGNDN